MDGIKFQDGAGKSVAEIISHDIYDSTLMKTWASKLQSVYQIPPTTHFLK